MAKGKRKCDYSEKWYSCALFLHSKSDWAIDCAVWCYTFFQILNFGDQRLCLRFNQERCQICGVTWYHNQCEKPTEMKRSIPFKVECTAREWVNGIALTTKMRQQVVRKTLCRQRKMLQFLVNQIRFSLQQSSLLTLAQAHFLAEVKLRLAKWKAKMAKTCYHSKLIKFWPQRGECINNIVF